MSDMESVYTYKSEDAKPFKHFKDKVNFGGESECWTWKGSINKLHGRPMFWFKGMWTPASRASLYFKQGYLTEGLHVCHDPIICNNKFCVNPFHLREDTPSANTLDLVISGNHNNKRKTHCKRNHEFSEDNIYYSQGRRHCRTCRAEYHKKKGK